MTEPAVWASPTEYQPDNICRVLALDGGGAKGFYTLGVLKEIESLIKAPLYSRFDIVFGTSTGAIIASLIALGYSVDEIHELYKAHVPTVMKERSASARSAALAELSREVFGTKTFEDVKTGVGIVTTRWLTERPMIFKGSVQQAHGRKGTFVPGFGVTIADAVQASCSAYPFFDRKKVKTSAGDVVELMDGGYCANNPTLYAIADAVVALAKERTDVRVLNVGVGVYPEPKPSLKMWFAKKYLVSVQLLQKTLEVNTQSMDQLRNILFKDIQTIRISDTFERPEMATDLLEHNLAKLNILRQRGAVPARPSCVHPLRGSSVRQRHRKGGKSIWTRSPRQSCPSCTNSLTERLPDRRYRMATASRCVPWARQYPS